MRLNPVVFSIQAASLFSSEIDVCGSASWKTEVGGFVILGAKELPILYTLHLKNTYVIYMCEHVYTVTYVAYK